MFKLNKPYEPKGDQPEAIEKLAAGLKRPGSCQCQTLVGVTGSGKTFTMANVIAKVQRPALVISHNKTLAAQLYQEFREFFPENAVHYFVSYYDYYQPEAYLPSSDTYIEKDAKINDLIDRLRHAATQSVLSRRDFIVVASVSCIYGIGSPEEYQNMSLELKKGMEIKRKKILWHLAQLQYGRDDIEKRHGTYKVAGDAIEITVPDGERLISLEFFGNKLELIRESSLNPSRKNSITLDKFRIYPAKHFVAPKAKLDLAISNIALELEERLKELGKQGSILEAERLKERVNFDLEMLRETGYVSGIENYSRHLSFRKPGEPPYTLLDYFPKDAIVFIDESHISIPQIRGMHSGDRARKQTLVDYGFRLPSALDNRPLTFGEFMEKTGDKIFVSATPAGYELEVSEKVVEQLVRPTGLLDPKIEVRPARGQIQDLIQEIKKSARKKERVLVLALTKRLAEEVSDYLEENNLKARYLHSEIRALERPKILRELRQGHFDVLVGVNLLREGLDLPEVALVAVLDADKEGFLRNATMLIQTIGRAARHPEGRAILYGDKISESMEEAIKESARRREYQKKYNKEHGIIPRPVFKEIRPPLFEEPAKVSDIAGLIKKYKNAKSLRKALEKEMYEAAEKFEFKKAAELRDALLELT